MQVTRLTDAQPYEAAKHFDMRGLRLQGLEASEAEGFWVGLSCFLPGGGAEAAAGSTEKVYVVTDGVITVTTGDGDIDLGPYDSCHIPAGETRSLVNRTNLPASMLVIVLDPNGSR